MGGNKIPDEVYEMKRILLIAISVLILVTAAGCADMLNEQAAKDRNLAGVVEENMSSGNAFRDHFESFEYAGAPGEYNLTVSGIEDAQTAATYAYNAMSLLLERNDSKVQTGRTEFKIYGKQGGSNIFEVFHSAGAAPRITLMGEFEGQPFEINTR